MAIWRVSNTEPKSIAEREIWTHSDKGEIVREILFTNGAYIVVTEDDDPPEFEREAVPGGDGAEDSVDMNFCGYDTQLISLEGGCKLLITWPEDMGDDEKQELLEAWDEGGHEAWEDQDWSLDDTEVWFWGDLNIEFVESGNSDSMPESDESWILGNVSPSSPGKYSIETVEKVVWPNFPKTEANWTGKKWVDDDGETVNVKHWKILSE